MELVDNRVQLEWLVLADSAQIANGKLYMLGGGWEFLTINSGFPIRFHMGLAVAFRIPWVATNVRHNFEIAMVNDDSQDILGRFGGEFEAGRAAGIPAGISQRAQVALEFDVDFSGPGLYTLRPSLNGSDLPDKNLSFRVVPGPAFLPPHAA